MLFENYNYFGRIFEAKTQIKIDDSYRTLNMVGISVEYKNILVPHIEIKPLAFLVDFPTKLNLRRAKKLDAFIDKNFALFHGVKTEVGSELNSFLGKEGIGQFIWKNGFCMAACNESTLILYRKGEIQALKNEYDQLRGEIDYLANIFLNSTGVKSKSHKASWIENTLAPAGCRYAYTHAVVGLRPYRLTTLSNLTWHRTYRPGLWANARPKKSANRPLRAPTLYVPGFDVNS